MQENNETQKENEEKNDQKLQLPLINNYPIENEAPPMAKNACNSDGIDTQYLRQWVKLDPLPAATTNDDTIIKNSEIPNTIDEKALRMMQKMGYKLGSGLGKDEQGIKESIKLNSNLGKRGLGLQLDNLNITNDSWNFSQENIIVNEKVSWLENQNDKGLEENLDNWIVEGLPNEDIVGNSSFCDQEVLYNVFKEKDIFDILNINELNQARARANPFETVRSVFFMNRAALKMANIDAACDFMFTQNFNSEENPIYFADVCAGPGGFTEYILWRKQWLYKGFGLTLNGEHDFKLSESMCASGATFQALYGVDETGDVCNPENLKDFTEKVLNETEGKGVYFMMSDGGFCVDGQENLQEVLSKNIYLCQCLLSLNILRPHGCFVTKLFDVFTPFSVGLLYLMSLTFEKVGIIKPNSSRPANSERYFVCKGFKVHSQTNIIREYLWKIAMRLWEIKTLPDRDILEIVPLHILKKNDAFFQYIFQSNCSIGKNQIISLKKLAQFCRNPKLIEPRQEILRKQCLEYWNIPNEKRKSQDTYKIENVLSQVNMALEVLRVQPRHIDNPENFEKSIRDMDDWNYALLYSSETINRTNFYAALGFSKVYRLQNNRWVKVKDLELIKGTLLFGEFVKETSLKENGDLVTRYSLHVIDALYLGEMDLQGYSFETRRKFIHIFCKAVNRESQTKYSVRVRPKILNKLSYLPQDSTLWQQENITAQLPKIGFKTIYEKYDINSVLLMKTNNAQTFQSTHVLKVQIFNTKDQNMTFDGLLKVVNKMLKQNE